MKSKIVITGVIALVISLASCKKDGPAGPAGPNGANGSPGPVLTGNLKGFVGHFDLSGSKMITNLAGDSVSIDGSSQVVVTDANGLYTFNDLKTGVYSLTVKRAGYGLNKLQDIQFTGGGDSYRNINISKIPTTNLSTFMAYDTTINTLNYIRLRGTIPSSSTAQSLIIFVGVPGNIVCNSSTANEVSSYVIIIAPNVTTYSKNIPTGDLYDLGYVSTNTAYFAGYSVGGNTNASSYNDLINNRTVYTALGSSPLFANALVQ